MAKDLGPRLVIPIDLRKKPWEQTFPLHNRWHPEIPPVARVTTGELFRMEMVDFSGGRITREFTIDDITHSEPSIVKCPFYSPTNFLFLHSLASPPVITSYQRPTCFRQ
ncbi:hypothetical protein MLD38_031390 [Melastoma candidum]|uniref:Uncharacterized protein n=1 Tax=Melastoma candidum TaxID=119954 RepID=A0ACB9MP55_9MYRT|nr:hypothetical protein MLD38_031390 [Melastoma candidum]